MTIRAIIVIAAYLAAQMLSDITSLKIIAIAGLSMDAGTLVYPLTFTLRDLVHKSLGMQAARVLIVTAAVINVVMAVLFWLVSVIPGDPQIGPQTAFAAVLAPVWRIVGASIAAEVLAELLDTEVYHRWSLRMGSRYQWSRVLVSNGVSTPIDSMLFAWLAFGGMYPAAVVWGIVASNVLLKYGMTIVGMPLIYTVREQPAHEAMQDPGAVS